MLPLAEATQSAASWNVVEVLAVLVALALSVGSLIRSMSGKSGERQIEPTQIAALRDAIAELQTTLNAYNRELGEGRVIAERTEEDLSALSRKQETDIVGAHRRIDVIDRDLAEVKARVSGIERQCPKC
jgi:hypothetical protein